MVVQAVMKAWLISRQQMPSFKQQLPDFSHRQDQLGENTLADDQKSERQKRLRVVPRRPRASSYAMEEEGVWRSHLFWKGIVFGLIAVVLVKMVFHVQAPFGIDWDG